MTGLLSSTTMYRQLHLRRTRMGPALTLHLREVSALDGDEVNEWNTVGTNSMCSLWRGVPFREVPTLTRCPLRRSWLHTCGTSTSSSSAYFQSWNVIWTVLQPEGFLEVPVLYQEIHDAYTVNRWDTGQHFCIRITIPEGSVLLRVRSCFCLCFVSFIILVRHRVKKKSSGLGWVGGDWSFCDVCVCVLGGCQKRWGWHCIIYLLQVKCLCRVVKVLVVGITMYFLFYFYWHTSNGEVMYSIGGFLHDTCKEWHLEELFGW